MNRSKTQDLIFIIKGVTTTNLSVVADQAEVHVLTDYRRCGGPSIDKRHPRVAPYEFECGGIQLVTSTFSSMGLGEHPQVHSKLT